MRNVESFRAILPEDKQPGKPMPEQKSGRRAEQPYVVIKEDSVSYLGVEVPKGHGSQLVPNAAEFKDEYFYLEGHYRMMRDVAIALLMNKPILLEGGTGVYNKTTTISRMCQKLNMNYCKVNFDRETAREDVIGGQTLKVDANGKESLAWYDGDLMYAIRNGGVAFLDEYNRQGKLAGIVNPIIDAILNGRKEISNPFNENERVKVHPEFRLVAAQNPPGMEGGHEYTDRSQLPAETFGRWVYKKLPIMYTEKEENDLLGGMIGEEVDLDISEAEFRSVGEGIPVSELAQIPGMAHWRAEIVTILRMLEEKSGGAKREMAKGQRQKIYFNPRLKKTIIDYIARFYNGDINQTVKGAFELCVVNMYAAEEDRQKIRLALEQAEYKPEVTPSKRRGAEREPKVEAPTSASSPEVATGSTSEFLEKRAALVERFRGLKRASGETTVLSAEHMKALDTLFGEGNLEQAEVIDPAELTAAYFDKMYPKKKRAEDEKKGLVSYRPNWWADQADASVVGPKKETWGEAYIRSMKVQAKFLDFAKRILVESIQKPNYTDGSQGYGSVKGETGHDWLEKIMKECFGDATRRFNHSYDELTASFESGEERARFIAERQKEYADKGWGTYDFNRSTLASPLDLVERAIEKTFQDRGLSMPTFQVILEPAHIFNRQTTELHPENSKTNTWEWSSTILTSQDEKDTGRRLYVGGAGYGGAGRVGDDDRGDRGVNGGFRLAVVLDK